MKCVKSVKSNQRIFVFALVIAFLICALPVSAASDMEYIYLGESSAPGSGGGAPTFGGGDGGESSNTYITYDAPQTAMLGLLVPELDEPPSYAPGDDSLPAVVTAILGTYTPRTQTVTAYLMDGTTVTYTEPVPGIAGVDWAYVSGVAIFAMILWAFFALVGGIFRHG